MRIHQLHTSMSIDEDVPFTDIPGLRLEWAGNVNGTIDAVSVYRNRCIAHHGEIVDRWEFIKPPKLLTPLPKKLYKFQKYGVRWLVHHLNHFNAALLADDMGLGKTFQSILAAKEMGGKTLVVCPGAVRPSWERGIKAMGGAKKKEIYCIYDGVDARDEESIGNARWVICSYDLLKQMDEGQVFRTVIIDEIHNLKNRSGESSRSRTIAQFCATSEYRIGLSGTPQEDRPRDWWKPLTLLFNGIYGNAYDFDIAYCGGVPGDHGGIIAKGSTHADELKHRLTFHMLRRTKAKVADQMPTLVRTFRYAPMDRRAKQLLQATALSPTRDGLQRALESTLLGKMPIAVEAALEAKKFLLFTWKKEHAREIHKRIIAEGGHCYLVTGDEPIKKRDAKIALAAKEGAGIVATLGSCGTGVDGLQHVASTGIFHALDWMPLKMAQAEDRLNRIGQKESVQWIYCLMKESIDEKMIGTITSKLDQWRNVMGNDARKGMRDALHAGPEGSEKATLAAIYESFGNEEVP